MFMDTAFETLRYNTFELKAEVTKTIIWTPGFKGVLLRDSVGNVLKNILPPDKYNIIWEQKLSKEISAAEKIGEDSPRGYVIEPPHGNKRKYEAGEEFSIRIILVGNLMNMFDDFIKAIEKLGTDFWLGRKTGYGSGKFKIKNISILTKNNLQVDQSKNLVLNFITPTRIVNEKTKKPLIFQDAQMLTFKQFIKPLYKRLYLLNKLYCNDNSLKYNPDSVLAYTDDIENTFQDLTFYNIDNKNNNSIKKLGGFVGEVIFKGELTPYLNIIKLGEDLHVGKDYVYGLGKYEIL